MRTKTQILKKLLSMLLCLAMLLSYVPVTAFAAADDVSCTCGVAEGEPHLEGCALYEASAELVCTCGVAEGEPHLEGCALYEASAELVCTCSVAEGEPHLEGCALYEAPADLVCTCQTKCAADSVDDECAVCSVEGADLTACLGTEAEDQGISYIRRSWNGSAVVSTTDVVTEYQKVTADTTELSAGRWYVVTGDVPVSATIEVKGKVNLILCDGASLTASQGIKVEKEDELYIYGQTAGTGKLTAHGKDYNPAIGPDVNGEAGIVKIYGGDIAATGGENGAGIDSIVDIYGGTVKANGGYNGAGIAGDTSGNGGIGIFGGTVTATGGEYGAGIGQGLSGEGGTINIYGGTVTATGGEYGAGIGQGLSGEGGKINIFGGTVTATGGYYGAGIGTGSGGSSETAMKITISGGTVTATGENSTGIGMGSVKQGGTITITGGMIKATGKGNFPGIGRGSSNFSATTKTIVSISGGTVRGESLGNSFGIGCGSQDKVPGGTVTLSGAAHIWSSSPSSTASAFEYLTEGEGVYYSRNAEDDALTENGPKSTTKFYEWIGEGHLCYVQNSDGLTHSLGCPTDCPKAVALGESQACSGGEATCAKPAKCTVCESYYGEVDKTKHDEAVAYVNGFCEYGCYEAAVQNDEGVYEISNAGQLYWFAAQVNSGKTTINGKLMKDIQVNQNVLKTDGTLNGDGSNFRTWTPIGNYSYGYDGTFDGGSHTVSGLYFNNSEISSVGLFGDTNSTGKVRNMGVTDSYFKGKSYVGGVVGWNGGTVTGCYNTGAVSGEDNVGGVVGYNASRSSITNCYNTGAVSGSSSVGGVVGGNHSATTTNCYNTGTVSGSSHVGGVVGDNFNGTITNCYNTGAVSGSDYVGGVVGYSTKTVTGCYNTGAVSGSSYVGGVVGYNASGTTTNCYNTGAVSGNKYVGGVAGCSTKTVTGCYNTGAVSGSSYVGGVAGYSTGTVTNCYYDKTVYTGSAIGRDSGKATKVEGKSTAQFASGEVAYLLSQGENGDLWGQDIGTDDYPVLGGDKVYYGYFSCAEDTDPVYTNDATASAEKPAHSTGADGDLVADCNNKAYCSVCESYYGEVDKTKHDEAVAYVNGFCEYGCYEPAVLNGDVYEISNAGQLYWFAQQVNSGKTTINGKLMDNITVNPGTFDADGVYTPKNGETARTWTPIGNLYDNYCGTFDGAGHTVSGLYCNNTDADYVGLFGRVGTGSIVDTSSISNVGVVNSYIRGNKKVGGVVGANVSGTIKDCYNTGAVSGNKYVGGVAGSNSNIMTGCYNTGAVSGNDSIGGVVGQNSEIETWGTITDCYNTGTVTGTDTSVGGVVGINEGAQSFIKNCYNTGAVNGGGGLGIGGVAGYSNAPITNCYSTGAVSGNQYVGGVLGWNYYCAVTNCYSAGAVSGSSHVGGVVGWNNNDPGMVANCYYRNDENGTSNPGIGTGKSGSAEAKTAEQFASGEVAYLLQGSQTEQVWGQDIDNGKPAQTHPVFSNAKVYYGYISCAEEAGQVYTNNENASETKPVHVPVAGSHTDIGGGKHSYECDGCGSLQTENHTFKVTTGACVCGTKRPAAVVSAPTANAKKIVFMDVSQPDGLMYNGKAQELIVAGEAEGGTMVYSLDADGDFTADIPTATNAGTYTVYYKVLGDDTHGDSEVASLSVTIQKATVWLSTLDMERCKDYDLNKLATGIMNWESPYYDDSNWIPYPTVDLRVYTDAPQGEQGTYDLFLEAEYDEANYDLTCVTAKLVVTDHHIFDQYTGTCACGSQPVAKLVSGDTTTYYATADEAFAAVMNPQGGVVTILKDAEINEFHATYDYQVSLVVEDGVTLTLNNELFVKKELSGTGTITANGNYEVSTYKGGEIHDITILCTLYNGATIYSGTFYGNVRKNYGTISGGTFDKDVLNGMNGEISGGVFHGAVNNRGGKITGGTFNGQLINKNEEHIESMEVVSYGTIINTTPGSFVLGDDFTIENYNGIINCTAHIWKDGACRLCDYRCNHSGSTHDSCTYENSAEHSFLCTVCSASVTQTHTYVDHICACGAGEPYDVDITGAGKITADVTTAYHGHDYVATLRNENGSGMVVNFIMIGGNDYSHWDGDFTYDAQTQQISIPGELVVDDVYIIASCTVKHTYYDNGGSFNEEYADFVNWYDDEAFEFEINYDTIQTPQVVVDFVQRTGYTMSGVKIGDTFYGMEDEYLGDEDRTLVIQWQPNTYDAVWMDGSDIYHENIQTYDAKVILPPNPQREGCTFLGWFTAEEGGERVTADTVYTNDHFATYYARFCDHSGNENDRYTYESETEHSIQCSVCLTTVKGSHENLFTVSQDGATCTVSCSANCGYSGTATISATGKTYDGNGVEVVVSKTGSLENTDIPVTLTKDGEAFTGEPVNAGAYTASITLGENENAVVASVEFIIEKANPVIAAAPTPNTLTYTSEALYLITAGEANGGTMVYSLTENGDYTTTIPQGTNAGDYTVWYYVQGDANHNDSAKDSVSVSIAKATVTVTADAKSKPYGTDNPTLTYMSEGLLGDDVLTGALETTATKTSNVGEYDITVGSLANSNYTIHFVGAKLFITKAAAPAITFPTAQNAITYGQQLRDVQLSFTQNEYGTFNWTAPEGVPNAGVDGYALDFYPNEAALNNYDWRSTNDALWIEERAALCFITQVMVNKADPICEGLGQNAKTYTGQVQNLLTTPTVQGGTILYSLDEQGEYTETIPTGKDAGEYTVWFKIIGDENYADIPAQSYTVEISKAELTVIVNNHTITYGDEPANAGAEFHGFQGAESLEDLDGHLTYSYTYSQYGDVGFYEIFADGLESHNYNIIYIPGTLQVLPKDLFVTADDVTKVFGEEDPALTYQAQGLVNGDTITGSLVRGGDERAETYTILRGDLSAGNNYNLIFTPGTFTITRKTLNGGDVTLVQSELPYTGYMRTVDIIVPEGVNYEVLDESDRATDVGYYELKIRFLDNYQGTATLAWQIIPVAPEYDAPTAKELTYTGTAQELITAGSTRHGTMVYALSEDGEYTETLPLGTDAGVYVLWYKVLGDNNHTDSQPASMTAGIDKASLRVYAQSNTITYGDAPAHNGVSYQGFLNGQTEEVLGGQLTYTYNYSQYGDVGQYAINVSGLGSNNYNITYYPGVLMVEPKVMDGAAISLPESDLPYTGFQQTVQIAAAEGVTYQVLGNSNTATDVGNYELNVQFIGNYQGVATLGWRITPVAPEYEAPTAKALIYSGQAQELIAAGSTQEGTMVYALTVDGEYTEAIPTGLEADTYTVWYKVLGDRNHTDTAPSALTVTISQKQLADEAVVLSEETAEFDGTDRMPTITVSDGNKTLEEGVDYTVTVTKDGEPQEEVKDAGEYVITVSGQGNYNMDIEVRFTVTECTHGGNTNTDDGDCTTAVECSVCHQIVTAAKDSHAFAIEVSGTRVDATCVATGSVTMQCVYCDATEVLTMEIDAGNHTGNTLLKNEAVMSCGSDGYTGDTYCADCDALLEKGEVIPANGEHNYATEVPGTRKDATCMATGSVTMKCLCGATKVVTLEIDPENHTGNNTIRDAMEATCEKPGYTGDTYCECGAKIASGEPIPVIDHNYQDGTCTECGGKDPAYVAKFDIDYANMTLGNSLAMNFAFAQSHRTDWTGCSVQIVKTFADGRPDKVVDVPYTQWEQTGINGSAYWKVKFSGVAAKEMSDIIYVTVYDADGKVISNVWEDSVRAYAMRMLGNRASDLETQTMAVDMLNYGAAAQDYFGYNTADLANNQLSDAQKALATKEAKATNSRVSNENYLGTNLRLESRIQLRMAFKDITDDMYAVIEFTSHTGSKVSWTVPASQMEQDVVVCVDQMVVADGRVPVTVTVYNADGTVHATATDSMESYIARMSSQHAVYEMILKFSDSAYNYFH